MIILGVIGIRRYVRIFDHYLILFLLSLLSSTGTGQTTTTCPNSNFSAGTFDNWLGGWGKWSPTTPCPSCYWYDELDTNTVAPYPHSNRQCYGSVNPGNCPPLHSLKIAPGTLDPNTGDSLITVFPGEPYSTRLGHNVGGAHISKLKYTVFVDSSNYLFVYRYAVVLQNPTHVPAQQPSFTIEVQDTTGAVLDSACGYYYIFAPQNPSGPLPPTWHKHGPPNNVIIWKEWTTVGMSLADYVGNEVTIVFTVRDCSPGGHFGYAYLSTYCSFLVVHNSMCEGDTVAVLEAPPGFSYLWSTGDTTASITVPHPTTGSAYSCTLTAINGCQVTIFDTLTYTVIHSNFTYSPSSAGCPLQLNDSSWINQNEIINWRWDFGDGSPPVTGIQNPVHTFAVTGTYSVTLKSYSTEGCVDSITKLVVADTIPDLSNNPLIKRICSRSATNILLTTNVPGTLFTWTASGQTPNVSGFSDNTTTPGTLINQTLANNGNTIDTVIYHITPHRGICDGIPKDFKVAVIPLPHLTTAPLNKSICNNTSTNISLVANVDSTKFTWTCTGSSPNVSGYSNNTTNPATIINQVLFNTGFNPETVTYSITPERNGCIGDTTNYIVTVFPVPDVYFSPSSQTICGGTSCNINFLSHVSGTNFTWTATGSSANVSGFSAGSGNNLQQTLNNSAQIVENVNYAVNPTANGCNGTQNHVIVYVNPLPPVSLTACWDDPTTTNASPFWLKGGLPLGGTYSGTGITANIFYPSVAGPGTHDIYYTCTNMFGCMAFILKPITVNSVVPFTCGNILTDIRDNKTYQTVQIGSQCWIAQNLNYGNSIPASQMQRDNCIPEKYCYNNSPANCSSSGALYQWDEMMKHQSPISTPQGLCPAGWHVPSESEWNTLFSQYISSGFAGSPLKETGYSGFDALLDGVRFNNKSWSFDTFSTFIWSSTQRGLNKAWAHAMNTYNPSVSYYPSSKANAFSVRCLKD